MKTFLQNKKMLIAVAVSILYDLFNIVELCIEGGSYKPILNFCLFLIGFLFVVSAFICNFNGKVKAAITCAVIALFMQLAVRFGFWANYKCTQNILAFLNILPETMLLVFLLKRERNIKTWSYIAWGAVLLPAIICELYSLTRGTGISIWTILDFVFLFIPNGFVYYFGFIDKNNAKQKAKTIEKSQSPDGAVIASKSKVASALLAFFLGIAGVHRYYLGYKKQGIIQTCGCVSLIIGYTTYILGMMGNSTMLILSVPFLLYGAGTSIWAFVDFIRILTGSLAPADGFAYAENRPAQVQVIQTAPSISDNIEALEKLANLHEQGILTDEEFQQKKADLLNKM